MKNIKFTITLLTFAALFSGFDTESNKEDFTIVRPSKNIKVWSKQISFLGSAPKSQAVKINDLSPRRNKSGHFASVMPLKDQENLFKVKIGEKTDTINVIKMTSSQKKLQKPDILTKTITPSEDIEIMPNEHLYISVMASEGAEITVDIGGYTKVLTQTVKSKTKNIFPQKAVKYEEYIVIDKPMEKTNAVFTFKDGETTKTVKSKGKIKVLDPTNLKTAVIKDPYAILRTGPSTSFGRLSPLPVGTSDYITKKEGNWLRLKYGGWIREKYINSSFLSKPDSIKISAIDTAVSATETKIFFKLNHQVPFTIIQEPKYIKINFYGAAHKSDIIRIAPKSIIKNIIWVPTPATNSSYIITTENNLIWGYDYEYKDNKLTLSLKHPPASNEQISVFLDAGHGGKDPGAIGPTGYPEKKAVLNTMFAIKNALESKGLKVITSRESDIFLPLKKRTAMIKKHKPTIALSIHYNANALDTDPFDIKGISMHWYQPHSSSLANFLNTSLVEKMGVTTRGVYWQTLFMTRLTTCPSVLMELGFITNPDEFDNITNNEYQTEMANAVADSVIDWIKQNT